MRRVILAIVGTAAALVFLLSFKTHSTSALSAPAPPAASAAPGSRSSAAVSSPAAASGASSPSSTPSASSPSSASSKAKTVTGSAVDTMYGPVQVQVTVRNGKVTAAQATEYPSQDPRDAQINSYAIPVLNSEAVAASSAQIDTVSGATYTSEGYISSLQSALDKAQA
jgi:uncharacterized protein with FMN-binding domain